MTDEELSGIDLRAAAGARPNTEEARALVAEVRRLRAIVEGRPTSPTTAEARAVKNAGGCFVRTTAGRVRGYSRCVSGLARLGSEAEDQRHSGNARWFVVDRDGRPCAWPVVEVTRG